MRRHLRRFIDHFIDLKSWGGEKIGDDLSHRVGYSVCTVWKLFMMEWEEAILPLLWLCTTCSNRMCMLYNCVPRRDWPLHITSKNLEWIVALCDACSASHCYIRLTYVPHTHTDSYIQSLKTFLLGHKVLSLESNPPPHPRLTKCRQVGLKMLT